VAAMDLPDAREPWARRLLDGAVSDNALASVFENR
jgi:hypothetical protein